MNRYSRQFKAFFFTIKDGKLCSYGTQYNRQLVSSWTLQKCFDVCEDTVREMKKKNMPCDAYCIMQYERGQSSEYRDCKVFYTINPVKGSDSDTILKVKTLVRSGLTEILTESWKDNLRSLM